MPFYLKREKRDVALLLITHLDLITEVLNHQDFGKLTGMLLLGDVSKATSSYTNAHAHP